MLKKAGIVVAATTAGLLALSPLAFADGGHSRHHDGGDDDRGHSRHHDDDDHDDDHDGGGLINISGLGVQVPVQLCGNDIVSGVLGVLAKDQRNSSSDDTACDSENSIED